DGSRRIVWPGVTMYAPAERSSIDGPGPGVHLLLGTEPSRMWKTFAAEVVEFAQDAEIEFVVFLGAMLADVPHTRPIATFASSEHAEARTAFGIERSSYEGPTGIIGVLADAF